MIFITIAPLKLSQPISFFDLGGMRQRQLVAFFVQWVTYCLAMISRVNNCYSINTAQNVGARKGKVNKFNIGRIILLMP